METMGKELELEISTSANALEKKAETFCLKLAELDTIENKLQLSIPLLARFNLIETN